jgi:uncharacterized membrane protein YfcA
MHTRENWWRFCLLGAAAGAANGLFGAGGGLILVPLFAAWIKMPEKNAFATSLAVMVPVSAVSLTVYFLRGGLAAGFAWPYLLGGAIGGVLAGPVFRRVPVLWLRRVMAGFLLYSGVKAVLLL